MKIIKLSLSIQHITKQNTQGDLNGKKRKCMYKVKYKYNVRKVDCKTYNQLTQANMVKKA